MTLAKSTKISYCHNCMNLVDTKRSPFNNIVKRNNDTSMELEFLDTIYEQEIKLDPIDIFTMQQLYGNYLSVEQLARELFVSTGTVDRMKFMSVMIE